jgi:gamma-glutamylcyclotransferase (GGCT)/AIG2-like uncharacterized protein YtfP
MLCRVSTAVPLTVGYVRQRRFAFHKRSVDGSAKADAVFTTYSSDRVWGVVYQLHQHQKRLLDRHEFLGVGYDQEEVEVVHEGGAIRAQMYIARRNAIDSSLLPYSWYQDLVIAGARQHRLPESYVRVLWSFDSVADPNVARDAANQRLIRL